MDKSSFVEFDTPDIKASITDEAGKPMEFSQIEEGNVLEVTAGTGCKYITVVNKIVYIQPRRPNSV